MHRLTSLCGVGVLKWLHENDVPFSAGSLATTAPREVFTPHQVPVRSEPKLDDLAPRRPLVVYGENGPTEVFHLSGGVTRIRYDRGRLKEITRSDGRVLRVHTDDLGNAVAMEIEGVGASAFRREPEGYVTFLDGVRLDYRDGRVSRVATLSSTGSAPLAEPWEVIEPVARTFIRERP